MIDWTQIRPGLRLDFDFLDLTDCHLMLQRWGSTLSFTLPNGVTKVYKLKKYPDLAQVGIDVVFTIQEFYPDGGLIPLKQGEGVTFYTYKEPESTVDLFAGYSPPQGVAPFGIQQAFNGLTRRLTIFEGHPVLQTGHRLFDFEGNFVQPVTFEVSNVQQETITYTEGAVPEPEPENLVQVTDDGYYTSNEDGSFEVTTIDGDGTFSYALVTQEEANNNRIATGGFDISPYTFSSLTSPQTVSDVAAGSYILFVQDGTGEYHFKPVNVPQEAVPDLTSL